MSSIRLLHPLDIAKAIFLACLLLATTACDPVPLSTGASASTSPSTTEEQKTPARANETYGPAQTLAHLKDPAITESSGIVASRSSAGIYWTHNDSGDGPFIYAFDERGSRKGVWRVTGASARDWEDIAAGPGPRGNAVYLYIGDIGDNDQQRPEVTVYRTSEPVVTAADAVATKSKPRLTEPAEAFRLRYPDGKHDAEALLVHPTTGNIYIITKVPFANPTVYEAAAPLNTKGTTTLTRLRELNIPSLLGGIITGGDIARDGRRVALCDYLQGYEIVLKDLRAGFDTIWTQPLTPFSLGERKQGEAIGYSVDGRALLATSEGLYPPLIRVVRR